MTNNEVWQTLYESIVEVLPDLATVEITPLMTLQSLGANSIDRAEVIMLTLARM